MLEQPRTSATYKIHIVNPVSKEKEERQGDSSYTEAQYSAGQTSGEREVKRYEATRD